MTGWGLRANSVLKLNQGRDVIDLAHVATDGSPAGNVTFQVSDSGPSAVAVVTAVAESGEPIIVTTKP